MKSPQPCPVLSGRAAQRKHQADFFSSLSHYMKALLLYMWGIFYMWGRFFLALGFSFLEICFISLEDKATEKDR